MMIETITRITLDPAKEQKIITMMEHSNKIQKVSETTTAVIFECRDMSFTESKEAAK